MNRKPPTSILQPILWLIGLLVTALTTSAALSAPFFILFTFISLLVISVITLLLSFIHLLKEDSSNLRSDSFLIEQMKMKKGGIGDDSTGILKSIRNIKTKNSVFIKDEDS